MPARITEKDVIAIAELAELELDASEADVLARQIGDILAYAEQVQAVDTTGVPPTTGTATSLAAERPDAVRPSLDPATALANAPEPAADAGLFKVPRVIG